MSIFYAQIDSRDAVIGISETYGEHNVAHMIPIDSFDQSLLGKIYTNGVFVPPPVPIDPCATLIDIGPFFDRFGAAKIPVLADPDAIVKAIVTDCMSRKWIDLSRADVGQAIDVIIGKGHQIDKTQVLAVPVSTEENRALRTLYFQRT